MMFGRRFLSICVLTLVLALSGVLSGCANLQAADDGRAIVYLVRHAEKELGPDPELTAEGQARAELLVSVLADAQIEVIYSTDYQRTRATAQPIARNRNLPVIFYDAGDLAGFAAKLKSDGRSVLVVGHSNTTPDLANALGGDGGSPIVEADEYDRLYRITLGEDVRTELLRFGISAAD